MWGNQFESPEKWWNPAAAELEGESAKSPGYSDQPVEGKKGNRAPSSLTEV